MESPGDITTKVPNKGQHSSLVIRHSPASTAHRTVKEAFIRRACPPACLFVVLKKKEEKAP